MKLTYSFIILGLAFPTCAQAKDQIAACPDNMPSKFLAECESSLRKDSATSEMHNYLEIQMKSLNQPESRNALKASQEAWENYVNKSCEYEVSSWSGGSGLAANLISCKTRYIEKRTQHLKEYSKCSENGCPQ